MSSGRAKDIFVDAIDLPPNRQDEFVRSACGADDALRTQVEGLLRAHRLPGLLVGPPSSFARPLLGGTYADDDTGPSAIPHRRTESPGDTIDRYRLSKLIGEGGFGSVFLAQQTAPLVRDVAPKVIRRGMDTDQIIARFEVERQALAMMDHPGIARVIDAGATSSGRPYFVMEYVDGIPITHYCEKHQLPL